MKIFPTLKKYKIDVIIVLALFCLAFGIRTMTADKFPNIYGFDSYWAAKFAKNIVNNGYVWPFNDTTTLYPYGRFSPTPSEFGWWGLEAGTYKVVAAINGVSGFDYNLFGQVASWLIVVVASMAIPAVYLFGRTAFNRWVGLSTALLLAVSGNHLFYSIFGHAENDGLGFTLFFTALFLFALTIKKKDWRIGLLSTFFFGWLANTWQSFDVAVLLTSGMVAAYFIIYYALNQIGYYKNSPERDKERRWMVYALGFVLASVFIHYPIGRIFSALLIGTAGFSILLCSLVEINTKKIRLDKQNFIKEPMLKMMAVGVLALVIGGLVFGSEIVAAPLDFVGINITPMPAEADYSLRMDTTIAEQNPIAGASFLDRLNTVAMQGAGISVWLALLAVIFIAAKLFVMPFVRKDFTWQWDIFAIAFVLMSMVYLTSKAVTTFFLAGAIAFGAGYMLGEIVHIIEYFGKYYEKYKKHAKFAAFSFILLVFFGFNAIMIPSASSFGYDVYPEWVNLFTWVNNNLANGSVITAWWDYGHWLSYYNGDRIKVTTDNAQYAPSIYTTALAFTHTVPCTTDKTTQAVSCNSTAEALEQSELEALSTLKAMGSTHILIDYEIVGGSTGGKFGALETIANNYIGCMQVVGCQKNENGSAYCLFGKNAQGQDVGLPFTADQWNELKTVPWPGISLSQAGIPTRAFARDTASGSMIYMSALACGNFRPDSNSPALFSFQDRLFFHDPSLKHVKLVYDDGWNVIYEINWKGVPDPTDSVLPNWQDTVAYIDQKYGG
jgi:dolichyl-diphosphooligosaccharide--protein glycosyltransferase